MTSRLYHPKDYAKIRHWWTLHGQAEVPKNVLPKCGVVVKDGKQMVCAAWLYFDNTVGVAWLAWLVSNPSVGSFKVIRGLKELIGAVEAVCKSQNRGLLFTMTDRGALGRFFQSNGFIPNHSGMTQYFRRIT